jgi:hypothetical protein
MAAHVEGNVKLSGVQSGDTYHRSTLAGGTRASRNQERPPANDIASGGAAVSLLLLEDLTERCAPAMIKAHGIVAGTAAGMLLLVGDNPKRIRSVRCLSDTGSTAAVTGRRMHPCTAWSSARAAISRLWTRPGGGRPRKRKDRDHQVPPTLRGTGDIRLPAPWTDIAFDHPT